MSEQRYGLADFTGGDLSQRWRSGRDQISNFLQQVGLPPDQHSLCMYIYPKLTDNVGRTLAELETLVDKRENWARITGKSVDGSRQNVISFPTKWPTPIPNKAVLALYIEIHSRLVSWWLINAWRSQQLSEATWSLGDSMQIIPAAACARSLLETAAAFWVDTRTFRDLWRKVKTTTIKSTPTLEHWYELNMQIWKMTWGGKFDKRTPDLMEQSRNLEKTNILAQIEKLDRVTGSTVQSDYQWLCNAVHPSVGGFLVFSGPMLMHNSGMYAFQPIAPFPISALSRSNPEKRIQEETIETALVRAATLAVDVLTTTLDDALKIIDDVALTTGAPQMASFSYWRNLAQKGQNSLCPCRSGRKVKYCKHRWSDDPPEVAERFGASD